MSEELTSSISTESTEATVEDAGTTEESVTEPTSEEEGSQETTGEEESQGDGEEGESTEEAQGAPDEYDFTMPEGNEYDQEKLNGFSEYAKERGKTQDQAQADLDYMMAEGDKLLTEVYAQQQQSFMDQQVQQKQDYEGSFAPEVRKQMEADSQRAVSSASDDFKALLGPYDPDTNPTGLNLGNNKVVIEYLSGIGAHMAEGTHVPGDPNSGKKERNADRLYAKTTPAGKVKR